MDVHFSLAAKRHDKTAHCLLGEHCFVLCVPDNQVVSRYAFDRLLCVLLEYLSLLELLDISDHHCLVLHDFDALFKSALIECFSTSTSGKF